MPIGSICRKVVLGFVLAAGFSTPAFAESLKDVLADVYEGSPSLQQTRASLRSTDEGVVSARARLLPSVGFSGKVSGSFSDGSLGNSESGSSTLGISASMPLYDLSSQIGVDVAEEAVVGARHDLASAEQTALAQAIEAYMQVRQADEIVLLRENNLRVIQEELRAAQDRFEVGEITRTDVALAEAALAQSQSALAQARGDKSRALEGFRGAVGRDPKGLSAPGVLPVVPDTVVAAKAIAARGHPDLLAAQSAVRRAELQLAQAEATSRATVSLSGSLGFTESLSSDTYSNSANFELSATKPIYQGGTLDGAVRQAAAGRDAARAVLNLTKLGVDQQIGAAYARLNVARANLEASDLQINAAQIAFDGVREEATLGARTTLDVLNAEQNLLDARANRVIANTELVVSSYSVLAAIGQLSAVKLKLKVDHYDPDHNYSAVTSASSRGFQLDKVLGKLGK